MKKNSSITIIIFDILIMLFYCICESGFNIKGDNLNLINLLLITLTIIMIFVFILKYKDTSKKDGYNIYLNIIFLCLSGLVIFNELYLSEKLVALLPIINNIPKLDKLVIFFILLVLTVIFIFLSFYAQDIKSNDFDDKISISDIFSKKGKINIIKFSICIILLTVLLIIYIILINLNIVDNELNYIEPLFKFILFVLIVMFTCVFLLVILILILKFLKQFNENTNLDIRKVFLSNPIKDKDKQHDDDYTEKELYSNLINPLIIVLYISLFFFTNLFDSSVIFFNEVFDNKYISNLLVLPFSLILIFVVANIMNKIISKNNLEFISNTSQEILMRLFGIAKMIIIELLDIIEFIPTLLEMFKYKNEDDIDLDEDSLRRENNEN